MNVKRTLNGLLREVLSEADANPAFRARLEAALAPEETAKPTKARSRTREGGSPQPKRPSNRRAAAVLDPVHLARQGEDVLRAELAKLDVERLRDIVADFGMDPGKLVLKWRDSERIIDRIVEIARGRAQKGSAFREQSDGADRSLAGDAADDTPRG